jgi:NADH-quinone oxidoreductase subunit A
MSNNLILPLFNNITEYFWFNDTCNTLLSEEYLCVFIFFLVALFLASLIMLLSYVLSVQNPETEKLSTYECGFEPYEDSRHQFDIKFYLVAILFIVFDIEAVYLYPWCVSISQLNITGFWSMIDFVIELGVGFTYVWVIGALNWD